MQMEVLLEGQKREQRMPDNIRRHTPTRYNHKIDQAMMKRVLRHANSSPEKLSARIAELDREWDLERVMETGSGMLALGGLALSGMRSRKWLMISAATLGLLLQHSITRRSAALRSLRALGIRTRREIDAEKNALRMLRGDFDHLPGVGESNHRALEALRLNRP